MLNSVSPREDFVQRFVKANTFETAICLLLCLDKQCKEKISHLAGMLFNQLLEHALHAELLRATNGYTLSEGIELLYDTLLETRHESMLDMVTDKLGTYEPEEEEKPAKERRNSSEHIKDNNDLDSLYSSSSEGRDEDPVNLSNMQRDIYIARIVMLSKAHEYHHRPQVVRLITAWYHRLKKIIDKHNRSLEGNLDKPGYDAFIQFVNNDSMTHRLILYSTR